MKANLAPITDDTLLLDLPVVVFDCETTGLDIKIDDIVSVGSVNMQGDLILPNTSIDQLINPQRKIPRASTKIHGIGDEKVAECPTFITVWRSHIEPALTGRVIVGHNIGFDIAHLRRATSKIGQKWSADRWLDTLLLYAALEPKAPAASLDTLASVFNVTVDGRHTALGDSLATAKIYQQLLQRLHGAGVQTLGQAEKFSRRPKAILRMQRRAGW